MAFKMRNPNPKGIESPAKNYKNPQDYKVFNMGNKPTPVKQKDFDKKEKYSGTIQYSPSQRERFAAAKLKGSDRKKELHEEAKTKVAKKETNLTEAEKAKGSPLQHNKKL